MPPMQPAFDGLAAGFPDLIFYLLTATAIYLLAIMVYVKRCLSRPAS